MVRTRTGSAEAFCLDCHYPLRGIGEAGRCPECGRGFDLADGRTFTRFPGCRRVLRILRRPVWAVLLLGLAMAGGAGWLYWEWRQEQAVIAWAAKPGGRVRTRAVGPAWVRDRAGQLLWLLERVEVLEAGRTPAAAGTVPPLRLRWVRWVILNGPGITDETVARLGAGGRLEVLYLTGTRVGDAGLRRLGRQPKLSALVVTSSPVTDAGLAALANCPALQGLALEATPVRGPGLAHLRHVPKLEWLNLDGTAVDDAALAAVGRCAGLKALSLKDTKVRGPGLAHLAGLKSLANLWLHETAIDDSAVEHLAKLTGLRVLNVQETNLTPAGVERLRKALPKATILGDDPTPAPGP